MWDYGTPYFSWPFLASGGGYPFKKTPSGYETNDIGVDTPGAVKGLTQIVELINAGVLPKGASYSVMEQKMNADDLATMISGPWTWANLRKSGIDFGLAPVPGVDGNPGRPFVGVLTALINGLTPNSDRAVQFIEKHVATDDGLKTINADVPIGVPARQSTYQDLAAQDPFIKMTYENARNGDVMPNIPQMGKFWSSMASAFQIATNGQASPQAALADAKKNMEK
jgi:maltose/maltodextrin transport system substrate-binding protein